MNGATIQHLLQHVVILVSILCRLIPGGATAREHPAPNPRNGPFRPTPAAPADLTCARSLFDKRATPAPVPSGTVTGPPPHPTR